MFWLSSSTSKPLPLFIWTWLGLAHGLPLSHTTSFENIIRCFGFRVWIELGFVKFLDKPKRRWLWIWAGPVSWALTPLATFWWIFTPRLRMGFGLLGFGFGLGLGLGSLTTFLKFLDKYKRVGLRPFGFWTLGLVSMILKFLHKPNWKWFKIWAYSSPWALLSPTLHNVLLIPF